jgi:hypothetical protein
MVSMEGIAIAVDDCIAHPFSPFSTLTSFYKDFFFVSMFMLSALVFRLIWVLFDFGNGYWIWRYFDGRFQGGLVWSGLFLWVMDSWHSLFHFHLLSTEEISLLDI